MSGFTNLFDYNNDGETSLTEYIIGEKIIQDLDKSDDSSIFDKDGADESDFNIFSDD